jgi:hypothetical protein
MTATTSAIRSICSLKLSIACAMYAGACFGSVAAFSAVETSGSACASAATSAARLRRAAACPAARHDSRRPSGAALARCSMPAQGDAGREHGEEAVAVREARQP